MKLENKQLHLLQLVEEIDGYAIILLNKHGIIETWNNGAEKIKGYSSAEVTGQNFRIFYTADDQDAGLPEALLAKACINKTAYNETWRVKKDGSLFWGAVTIMAIYNDNQLAGFAKITRDLTERVMLENAVRQQNNDLEIKNREIEQFVYIASHDLQEPLLNVANFINLFKEEYKNRFDDNALLYLDFISRATCRMQNLIYSLLDYSRLGTQRVAETVDLNELLKNVTDDLATSIKNANASITYNKLPKIQCYATELAQLFQNLLSNAIKFCDGTTLPDITITANKKKDCWQFQVRDNGIGIDPRFHQKIFVIFQRAHNQACYDGNGIGLAHCKKIVELHKGDICVTPNDDRGSTFTFTISFDL